VLSEIKVKMTTAMIAMPSSDDQLMYDQSSSAIADELRNCEIKQLPACFAHDSSHFNSYRQRGSRKGRAKPRRKVILSSSWVSQAKGCLLMMVFV
jgi:hypothetical protein